MAIRFQMLGIEMVCDTADEAYALASKLAKASQSQSQARAPITLSLPDIKLPGRPSPSSDEPKTNQSRKPFDIDETLKTFMKALDRERPNAVTGEQLSEALGLAHPKALGGRLALINKRIKEFGFEPEDVYKMRRDSSAEGRRVWFCGEGFDRLLLQLP